jgi:hypothetical protein
MMLTEKKNLIHQKYSEPVEKCNQLYHENQFENGRKNLQIYVTTALEKDKEMKKERQTKLAILEEKLKLKDVKYTEIQDRVKYAKA